CRGALHLGPGRRGARCPPRGPPRAPGQSREDRTADLAAELLVQHRGARAHHGARRRVVRLSARERRAGQREARHIEPPLGRGALKKDYEVHLPIWHRMSVGSAADVTEDDMWTLPWGMSRERMSRRRTWPGAVSIGLALA